MYYIPIKGDKYMPSTDSDKSKPLTEVSVASEFQCPCDLADRRSRESSTEDHWSLAPDELLVRVNYASINKMDPMLAKRNLFQLPAPYVLGFDFSGVVVKTGK